jgi:hypothetical protein
MWMDGTKLTIMGSQRTKTQWESASCPHTTLWCAFVAAGSLWAQSFVQGLWTETELVGFSPVTYLVNPLTSPSHYLLTYLCNWVISIIDK